MFAYVKTKAEISCAVTVQLISPFVFTTKVVELIPLFSKSEISSLQPSPVPVQLGLCRTWPEIPKTEFLMAPLIYVYLIDKK